MGIKRYLTCICVSGGEEMRGTKRSEKYRKIKSSASAFGTRAKIVILVQCGEVAEKRGENWERNKRRRGLGSGKKNSGRKASIKVIIITIITISTKRQLILRNFLIQKLPSNHKIASILRLVA